MITTARLGGLVERNRLALALATLAAVALALGMWFRAAAPSSLLGNPLASGQPTVSREVIVQSLLRHGIRPDALFSAVDVILVTPEYLAATNNDALLGVVQSPSLLFYLYEEGHDGLPAAWPRPLLSLVQPGLDSTPLPPTEVRLVTDSPHHRSTLVRYEMQGALLHLEHGMGQRLDLILPAEPGSQRANAALSWDLPLRYTGTSALANPVLGPRSISAAPIGQPSALSIATVLGLLGGFLASMWPCLFQLTAYFIPSLAGVSYGEARARNAPMVIRRQVLRTAVFFVLGIVTVYTAAGAIIGLAAQSLAGTSFFQEWQRPLTVGAALVIIVMAIRVAVQGRAPLVCKMPILSRFGRSGPAGPVGTIMLGLAFATGCMTCFGAAIALGLVVYALSSASPLTGALLLFLFSLGISIPLVIAAIAMAQVLPLLGRLERWAPWMALASSAIMIAFAGLLLSGQYHALNGMIAAGVLRG